jgi:glutamate---cysteine ligase / carboxylate-amine ligase
MRKQADSSPRPAWAHWSQAAAERPWTVGIEEEVMLLDGATWSVANRIDDVVSALPSEVAARVAAETHACVIELQTQPHATVAGAAAELSLMRDTLDRVLRIELELRAAAAGTHPLAIGSEVAVSTRHRYREVEATMRALARREPTMALHVHVAVPDGRAAVRALDGLRGDLPLLLALSANSPYWRSRDSGFASIRTPIFSMFPRVGIPRHFGSYAEYVHVVEELLLSEAVPDPGFLWWDARLQPRLGTVEVRIMDSQSRLADAASLAAVVQCLVRRHADARHPRVVGQEALAENRFLAARDGMGAAIIEAGTGHRRPVPEALTELLTACRPVAAGLGCAAELAHAAALADDPGDARQRRLAAHHGLTALPALLADEFAPAPATVVAV